MVKICLMVASLSLFIGCKHAEFPVDYYYSPVMRMKDVVLQDGTKITVVDLDKSFCGRYRVIDKEKVIFQRDQVFGLLQCNGMFGTSSDDTPVLLDFIRDRIKKNKKSIEQME